LWRLASDSEDHQPRRLPPASVAGRRMSDGAALTPRGDRAAVLLEG